MIDVVMHVLISNLISYVSMISMQRRAVEHLISMQRKLSEHGIEYHLDMSQSARTTASAPSGTDDSPQPAHVPPPFSPGVHAAGTTPSRVPTGSQPRKRTMLRAYTTTRNKVEIAADVYVC